ncbi:MAG: hypothetical protein ACYDGN_04535 [Acidimicrobiales bacterium]
MSSRKSKQLIANCQLRLDQGETLRYVFTTETGLSRGFEALGWIPGFDDLVRWVFVFANKPRTVVVSDKRIVLFSASRLSRRKPKKMLQEFPRATRLEHGMGRRSTVKLGDHSLRVERRLYRFLDKANAEIEGAVASA